MNDKGFNTDIIEIKEVLTAYGTPSKRGAFSLPISRMTEKIDEDFLCQRGKAILSTFNSDTQFAILVGQLAEKCEAEDCENCPIRKYCNYYINRRRDSAQNDSIKMIDLFCGAGGLSLGFSQEGFVAVLANDIEDCCVDTYSHNHPEIPRSRIVKGDINDMIKNLDSYLGSEKVSIIVGGPPCQGFSMANRQRLIDDPRNHLYRSYVEVVKRVCPPFFVMENVKGMLRVAEQVIEDFESIGYSVSARILNAKDFGVPQNRERLIYIGNRVGIDNNIMFKEITASSNSFGSYILQDALFGLKPLIASRYRNTTEQSSEESGGKIARGSGKTNAYIDLINQGRIVPIVYNHKARYNNDRDIEIFRRLNPGDRSDDPKIADIMPYKRRNNIFKDKYFKLEPTKVCKTITAHMKFDCNMYIHPTQPRGLTPREAARVQSFPDDYYFRGAYTKTYMQIGNSVPPLLGRSIAHIIKKYLRGE